MKACCDLVALILTGLIMASARGHAGECKAKDAIYGGTDRRPLTPQHHGGKKMVLGATGGSGALPFATMAGAPDGDRYPDPQDFHLVEKPAAIMGKVGTQEISSDVYRRQMEMNITAGVQSRMRNSGGPSPYAADYQAPPADPAAAAGFAHLHRTKDTTGKVGEHGGFGAEVYAAASNGAHTRAVLKKFGAGVDANQCAPFATDSEFDEHRRRDYYHAKAKKGQGEPAAKPNSERSFDPSPYSQQLPNNHGHQIESTQRSFSGSGNIFAPRGGGGGC